MNKILFSFLLITAMQLLNACMQGKAFNKTGWQETGDLGTHPNRNDMLKDLTTHHRLKGLSYRQLVDFLGEPEGASGVKANTAYYNIITDYRKDIDPVYIKNLIINFNADSIVSGLGIEEIKH